MTAKDLRCGYHRERICQTRVAHRSYLINQFSPPFQPNPLALVPFVNLSPTTPCLNQDGQDFQDFQDTTINPPPKNPSHHLAFPFYRVKSTLLRVCEGSRTKHRPSSCSSSHPENPDSDSFRPSPLTPQNRTFTPLARRAGMCVLRDVVLSGLNRRSTSSPLPNPLFATSGARSEILLM